MANFIRTKHYAYFCLGKKQKSKRKYRRPTGRHNKTRQKWKSRTPMVEVGYKNSDSVRGLIEGKMPVFVSNVADLAKVGKENVIIIANVGNKKRIEIFRQAQAKKLEIANLNTNKFTRFIKRQEKFSKKPAAEAKEAKK